MGALHSTKNSEIFEMGTNGTEISWDKFQKIRKLLNFRKANHLTENSGNSEMKNKWKRNFQEKMFENLATAHEGRFPFDQKFRCEFPEISMGEWYRLFQCGKRQATQFCSLGIFQ